MPNLHVHLSHGIGLDGLGAVHQDAYEDLLDEHYEPVQRAAKRRRIETIAAQYLRGRAPLILSAGLKGPFNKGWKNPWAKKPQREKSPSGRNAGLKQADNERATSTAAVRENAEGDGIRTRTRKLSPPPSPETSRAVENLSQVIEPVNEQRHQDEAPLSDSPALHNDSGGTEFHGVDADPPITINTSESNSHWLRRHSLEGMHQSEPKDANTDPSPTRTRAGRRPIHEDGELQLVPPRLPLTVAQSSPMRTNILNSEWRSGASASMVISSLVKPTTHISTKAGNVSPSRRNRAPPPSSVNHSTSSNVTTAPSVPPAGSRIPPTDTVASSPQAPNQCAQLRGTEPDPILANGRPIPGNQSADMGVERPRTFTPINIKSRNSRVETGYPSMVYLRDAHPSIAEGHRAASNLALLAVEKARNSAGSKRRPSREEIHVSAERCAQTAPSSNTKGTSRKAKRATSNSLRRLGINLTTSPTSISSTGLPHRRVGEEKSMKGGQKSKPRPVTFSSLPAVGNCPHPTPEAHRQELTPVEESRSARRDVYEIPPDSATPKRAEQQQNFRSTRNSDCSTQAAMMVARLEFQEGTMPSVASETPGARVPIQDSTLKQYGEQPSLVFTPFSAFNADLDKRHPQDSAPKDLLISTQELFSAAPPFAFSTIKKAVRPQGSHAKFAVFPSGEQNGHVDQVNGAKSPPPPERIPLKERNSKMSFQSTVSEKGSQESTSLESKAIRPEVALPQLDLRTSLDHLGPDGDLEFTDRFLRNLKDMT